MPSIKIDGLNLYHETHGEGAPLVCINGMGAHLGYWAPVLDALAARHRTVVYDHRGTGRSDCPPGPYSIAQMTDDLIGLLDALGLERASFIGHSMGGSVALQLAALHPARIDRLVLYSTSPDLLWPSARFLESVERVWTECPDISSGTLTRIFTPWSWSPAKLANQGFVEVLTMLADNNPYKMTVDAFRAQLDALRTFDGTPLLARVHAPTLIIGGSNDLLTPLSAQQRISDHVRGSRLAVSTAGHNTHLEESEWFVAQVLGFTAKARDEAAPPTER